MAPPNGFAVDLAEDAGTHQHKITGLNVLINGFKDGVIHTGIMGLHAEGIGA